jgi:hypothetical protein
MPREDSTQGALRGKSNDEWFDEELRERLGRSINEGKSAKAWGGALGKIVLTHLRGTLTQDDESVRHMGCADMRGPPRMDMSVPRGTTVESTWVLWAISFMNGHDDLFVHGLTKGRDTPKGSDGSRW